MANGKFEKGDGRPRKPKGALNKTTAEIKDMIRNALEKAGGEEYLLSQAQNNPQSFLTLLGKIIPTDVHNKLSGGAKITVTLTDGRA